MLKLPKDVIADPRHDVVAALLTMNARPLWEKGTQAVATIEFTSKLALELRHALKADLATQGLEQIAKVLEREQKGLDAVAERSPQAERISRVLFVASDGSERFYRDCDRLLGLYSKRLAGCRLDVPGERIGEEVLGQAKLVRAILITDKKALARILLSLV